MCPGSFDPVTLGHLDVITRAAGLFDEVIVAVGHSATKAGFFPVAERLELIRASCELPNVRVEAFSGLLVEFCAARSAGAVVKGVRSGDLDYELQMAQMNRRLSGLETVLLPTAPEWGFVSSTLVRQIASMGGDVSAFVPPAVADRTISRARDHG